MLSSSNVSAADSSQSSSSSSSERQKSSFTVQAIIPDEQQNKDLGYFDLTAKPNSEHTLGLRIFNTGVRQLNVSVELNNAYTSDGGVVAYDRHNQKLIDPTTKSMADLVENKRQQTVKLAPGELKTVNFKVKAPAERYKGMILGAVVASAKVDPTKSESVTINNRISYNIGVVLRQDDTDVKPSILVGRATPGIRQLQKGILLPLHNRAAMNASRMAINAKIYHSGQVIKTINRANMQMAPFSKFTYFLPVKLKAGNYRIKGSIIPTNGGQQDFDQRFTVTKAEAKRSAIPKAARQSSNLGWIILLIVLGIILIAVIWIAIYFFAVQSGKEKRQVWQQRRQKQRHSSREDKANDSRSTRNKRH
ncbi:DUF916 and DUF3324 domain-containing protein [Agrilactobacillus fermenti]|uniref:DUF916 and DUF3324 domain-containing protein n=1 Tax=Agrilactobacillus fermenti TaxID=2586909 RepID=UPI001E42733F|nr:DUF916 and DUF3324 domain-containing protein [Agrilactobacillus fermenti]